MSDLCWLPSQQTGHPHRTVPHCRHPAQRATMSSPKITASCMFRRVSVPAPTGCSIPQVGTNAACSATSADAYLWGETAMIGSKVIGMACLAQLMRWAVGSRSWCECCRGRFKCTPEHSEQWAWSGPCRCRWPTQTGRPCTAAHAWQKASTASGQPCIDPVHPCHATQDIKACTMPRHIVARLPS